MILKKIKKMSDLYAFRGVVSDLYIEKTKESEYNEKNRRERE